MSCHIPKISNRFACIVDRTQKELAAVISSYLSKQDEYLPIFEFPIVTAGKNNTDDDFIDEHIISRSRSNEFNILVNAAIGRNGGCRNLILAGLSDDQKSYLTFLKKYNLLNISSFDDVDVSLSAFAEHKEKYLSCRKEEILEGLYQAVQTNSKLKIEENADQLTSMGSAKGGIIVIENISAVSTVIAVNYALSIDAEIKIVEPLAEKEEKEISYLIQEWKKGTDARYHELSDKVHKRIEGIYFQAYEFATFFTKGLPYSLIIHDVTPCTYVHLLYRPDFFIFNNLLFEKKSNTNSAIVFSPQFFKDEETEYVSNYLQTENIYVQELIGKLASVYNIDMHVKEFPYDLLHICSHGGEVNGYSIAETFRDRDGNIHTVEYDEVVGFGPIPNDELIQVHRKTIWRKFDGVTWGSSEFKAKEYPHYVFADMETEMNKMFDDTNHKQVRTPKAIVPDSCSIKCSNSVYQAMFQFVAGLHTSPVIFNNSCWSWSGIADSFLAGGARGYIGTLWKINNKIATQVAKVFYDNLFKGTILSALQIGMEACRGTENEGIYIYWGLHFSTIKKGATIQKSRENIFFLLLRSYYRWVKKAQTINSKAIKENIKQLVDWDLRQLTEHFFDEYKRLREASDKSANRK